VTPPSGLAAKTTPLAIALVVLGLLYVVTWRLSLSACEGQLSYALDDAYIQMAMAKTLAQHGTWGLTPYQFTSSTSSPLWVLLLAACDRVFGVTDRAPAILEVLCAVALVVACDRVLRRLDVKPRPRTLALVAVVILTPVVPIAFCGLEHLLHATACVWFAAEVAACLGPRASAPPAWRLALTATLMVAARYEGVFLLGPAVLLLAADLQRRRAVLVAIAGLAPAIVYGLFSLRHGWRFLPSSILLKAQLPHEGWAGVLAALGGNCVLALSAAPHVLVLVLAGTALLVHTYRRRREWRQPSVVLLALALAATLLHLQLARIGWFYRYEGYLVALWIVALGVAWPDVGAELIGALSSPRTRTLGGLVLALAAVPLLGRAARAHVDTPAAAAEIHGQQFQMGLFARRFFDGRVVAVNDIGAVSFLANVRVVDLVGLGTKEILDAQLAGMDDATRLALAEAQGAEIAILYERWLPPVSALGRSWRRVGTWTIPTQVAAGDTTVTFFAIAPGVADYLAASLRAFSPELPASVEQGGPYLDPRSRPR
jgi:hypothetical protein